MRVFSRFSAAPMDKSLAIYHHRFQEGLSLKLQENFDLKEISFFLLLDYSLL